MMLSCNNTGLVLLCSHPECKCYALTSREIWHWQTDRVRAEQTCGQSRDMEARLDATSNGEEGPAGETQYVASNAGAAGQKSSTTL